MTYPDKDNSRDLLNSKKVEIISSDIPNDPGNTTNPTELKPDHDG